MKEEGERPINTLKGDERNNKQWTYADSFVVGAAEQQSTCLSDGQRTNAVAMSHKHGAALQGRLLANPPYLHREENEREGQINQALANKQRTKDRTQIQKHRGRSPPRNGQQTQYCNFGDRVRQRHRPLWSSRRRRTPDGRRADLLRRRHCPDVR